MQEQRICRKNSKCAPDKKFCGHFCPRRNGANSCHPAPDYQLMWCDIMASLVRKEAFQGTDTPLCHLRLVLLQGQ